MASRPQSVKSLLKFSKEKPENIDDLIKHLEDETDRSIVVIMGAVHEDTLAGILAVRLAPEKDRSELWDLFQNDGPMATFSSKILVAHAVGAIDADMRDYLDVIRHMRNACAHAHRPISFATPELAAVCKRVVPKDHKVFSGLDFSDRKHVRTAFEGCSSTRQVALNQIYIEHLELAAARLKARDEPTP